MVPDYRAEILRLLGEAQPGGVRRNDLRRLLRCSAGRDRQAFKDCFRELLAEGLVMRKRGGRYVRVTRTDYRAGTIAVKPRGFGFVVLEGADAGAPDVFIPPAHLGGAISGDRVLVQLLPSEDERGPVGRVARIVQRRHELLVGCLTQRDGQAGVRPLRRELPDFIPLAFPCPEGIRQAVRAGEWARVRLCPRGSPEDALRAEVTERLGPGRGVSADLDAVVAEFGLPEPYSPSDEEAAAAIRPIEVAREDLRRCATLTIDPADAKDYDDALSIEADPSGRTVTVGVHIADVAVFVPAGGEFDLRARLRGFTSYLPGRTIPMLPNALAGDRCSLLEGAIRPAHSLLLTICATTGAVLSSRRVHTLIQVDRRLSFDTVQQYIDNRDGAFLDAPVRVCLSELLRLSRLMRQRRAEEEAFLTLALPTVGVCLDEIPLRVTGLNRDNPGEAHRLVEEFMLAANTAVAREMIAERIPALFRNHESPSPASLAEFARWAAGVLGISSRRLDDRAGLNRLLAESAASPLAGILLPSFLQALPRASYAAVCLGHYGLGKDQYCHFTSPIRRCPDLIVHQQLLSRDLGLPPASVASCEQAGATCTALEERVDAAYYAALDRLKIRYLEDRHEREPGSVLEGMVARVSKDGLFVYLPEAGLLGRMGAERLPGRRWRLSRDGTRLASPDSPGKNYKCGDVICVQIRSADTVRGTLELQPVQLRV